MAGAIQGGQRVGPVDYEIHLAGRQKEVWTYHVNVLKERKAQERLMIAPFPPEIKLGPLAGKPVEPIPIVIGAELDLEATGGRTTTSADLPHCTVRPPRVDLASEPPHCHY